MKLMVTRLTGLILTAVLLAFSPPGRAAHATNFLEALSADVTNRLTNASTNVSRAQVRALGNAARVLNRNSKTLPTDLEILATAAGHLNGAYDDGTFDALEAEAIANYSAEAHAQLDVVYLRIGTNSASRGLSNQVVKADAALDRADATTDGVVEQARTLAGAFRKIAIADKRARALYPGSIVLPPVAPPPVVTNPPVVLPPGVPPGTPGLAPDSLGTRFTTLYENDVVNDQTVFYFSTAQTGAQIYNVHHPEELGLWVYVRSGANTAVIVVDPDYPNNASQRLLNLTFTTANSGTFTGTTYFGDALEGTFTVSQ